MKPSQPFDRLQTARARALGRPPKRWTGAAAPRPRFRGSRGGAWSRASDTGTGPPPRIGRVLEFTDWAIEILSRADAAARRFNPDARLRVVRADGGEVRFELAEGVEAGDRVVEHPSGFTLLAQEGLEGTVDVVEPHDRLILRSPDDPERSVRAST